MKSKDNVSAVCPACGKTPKYKIQYAPKLGWWYECTCGTRTVLMEFGKRLEHWDVSKEKSNGDDKH